LEVGGVEELDHGWVGGFVRCKAWILGTTGSVFQGYGCSWKARRQSRRDIRIGQIALRDPIRDAKRRNLR
jgi:hypothetical protein